MKVFLIAGARPNFMKIAPLFRQSQHHKQVLCEIVHTGQHYDYEMSQAFFDDLELPEPHHFLESGSGSHAVQTGRIMTAFESLCCRERPDLVVVVGDVNSTIACSLVARKMQISTAHIEAGLRSFDLSMPEEINRVATDAICDLFFVTEESGVKNLLREGKDPKSIHFVGNVMIDNLFLQFERLQKNGHHRNFNTHSLKKQHPEYMFLTLHRPSNVDNPEQFLEISEAINKISTDIPIIFPVHPRTRKKIMEYGITFLDSVIQIPPLGFLESLFLWKDARLVITDSGGLQEETTALGIPCITVRDNTERPITIEKGTNVLAGTKMQTILEAYRCCFQKTVTPAQIPGWDGKASTRIWEVLTHADLMIPEVFKEELVQ